jgi:hypothetical protein
VRLYAPDIADRLSGAGLSVTQQHMDERFPARRHGLIAADVIFHCAHPSSSVA